MSQVDDLNFLDTPSAERLARAAAAHAAKELLPIPRCPRLNWIHGPLDVSLMDLIAMEERITSKGCFDSFMSVQAEKFRSGKELRCSEGLARQIRRLALEQDLDL